MTESTTHRFVATSLTYVCLTLLLDWVSTIGLYRGIGVTPWSPATGISLAFSYAFPLRAFPALFVGDWLSLTVMNPARLSNLSAIVVSAVSSGIWLAAGLVMRRSDEFDAQLRTLPSLRLIVSVAVGCAVLHALTHMSALWLQGVVASGDLTSPAWRLAVGDLVGILVVTPLILLATSRRPWSRPSARNIGQVTLLIVALYTVFAYRQASAYQLFYLLFLPILWAALRDGMGTTVVLLNIAQIGLIVGTQFRADFVPGTGSLQLLMIALAMTGLIVAAVVSEREAAYHQLREQQSAISRTLRLRSAGETAAAIAHQINQPITAISTYASVARDAIARSDGALADTALTRLSNECERASAVVRSIRDLVKQGALAPTRFSLAGLMEQIKTSHAGDLQRYAIGLQIELAPGLPDIVADRVQLEQAIDNLVVNAIEAIAEIQSRGTIRVTAAADGAATVIDVSDDGPGFAPGLGKIVTTPFVTTKRNGSGLGLAIARSVAEAHGGSLTIMQRSEGACVRIRLPTLSENTG